MTHYAIIGTGLIGGSLAKALKAANDSHRITAIDTDAQALALLHDEGVIDSACTSLASASLQECDMLLIAVPPDAWEELAGQLRFAALGNISLMMDVGSVKAYALDCFGEWPQFLPAHPIAGSEFSGAAFSDEQLFANKQVIITPRSEDGRTTAQATLFWESLGAQCSIMSAERHDVIYAHMSHLPQLCAYAIAGATLPHLGHTQDYTGFLRLAGSSPSLWLGIFRHNPHLASAAEHFLQILGHMIAELRTGSLDVPASLQLDVAALCCPRIIASCLISSVTIAERTHDMKMARYAGSGFADMTAAAMTSPEEDLARISEHSDAVVALLEMCEQHFRAMLVAIKRADWELLYQMMVSAQQLYVNKLH